MFRLADDAVAHLLILVGRNPLPNYVSALAIGEPGRTALTLIYTRGSFKQRDLLGRLLGERGFTSIADVEVEEANPTRMSNVLSALTLPERKPVVLDYTGGTKAMAVHAYRTLSSRSRSSAQGRLTQLIFSYLDARTLSLQLEDCNGLPRDPLAIGADVKVSIETLLRLHGLDKLKKQMQPEPLWPSAAAALLEVYLSRPEIKLWRAFCARLRDNGNLRSVDQLGTLTFGDLEQASPPVGAAFRAIYPQLGASTPLAELARLGGFKPADSDFARWLDGSWLEHAVLASVKGQGAILGVHEAVVTVNPLLPPTGATQRDFEFDVCFVRGYQLFAVSCTTSAERKSCKSRLLEAVVRAQQLGGAEARVGLVCCYDQPADLEGEVQELLGGRVRVFGRGAFASLDAELGAWVKAVSAP